MALTIQQLLTPSTEDESLASILTILQGLGFTATSWQSGSIQLTLIRLLARLHSEASAVRVSITAGRFNDLATGPWLALKSISDFDNKPLEAVATQVELVITDPNNVGPQTITLGQLVATDPDGNTYRSITTGTIALGGTLTVTMEAEVPGAASNPFSLTLSTPLAGFATREGNILRVGADAEIDSRLRIRNRTKWASLAYAAPGDAYIAWALAADPAVTRAYVDDLNPRGPGTIDVYAAGASGGVPGSVLTNIMDYMNGVTDGIYRRPIGSNVEAFSASTATITISGTLYTSASYTQTAVKTAVQDAVTALLSALPVGGTVLLAELYATIMAVTGVNNVHLTAPTSDTTIVATSVPVPSFSLSTIVS